LVKSGTLNLQHFYKYRALDDYLIERERWASVSLSNFDWQGRQG
jgi:hypothetical protein